MFPEKAGWDLNAQLLASIIDIQHWFQWARMGGTDSGYPVPDPIPRPGVERRKGDHRRGNAKRSETNKELGMNLANDPARMARLKQLFSGSNPGPVRDLRTVVPK
jgi:hypothetical protein